MNYYNHIRNKLSKHNLLDFDPEYNIGSIFCLHRVTNKLSPKKSFNNYIEIDKCNLEKLLHDLILLKVDFVSLSELYDILNSKKKLNKPIVHFSFDDGYYDNYKNAFPLFEKYRIPFSIFPTISFIDEPFPFVWWYLVEELLFQTDFIIDKSIIKIQGFCSMSLESKMVAISKLILYADYNNYQNLKNYFLREALKYKIQFPRMLSWLDLTEMKKSALCEIGGHSIDHLRGSSINLSDLKTEIIGSINLLESSLGLKIRNYAYPFASISDLGNIQEISKYLNSKSIDLAFTTEKMPFTVSENKYLIPRVFLNNDSTLYSLKVRLNGFYFK